MPYKTELSVLERVDRKPKFSHFGCTKRGVRNANDWPGDEARRTGPSERRKKRGITPSRPFFPSRPPLRTNSHLVTILISDALRVRASSS